MSNPYRRSLRNQPRTFRNQLASWLLVWAFKVSRERSATVFASTVWALGWRRVEAPEPWS